MGWPIPKAVTQNGRRELLRERVLAKLDEPILELPELESSLPELIRSVKAHGLEGLVAKRRDSRPAVVKSLVLLSGGTDWAGRQFLRQASHLPALFSVADDDEFPPTVEMMPWLFNLSANPGKKYVHYATGGHGADIFAVHPELRDVIVDWYVTTLIKTPSRASIDKSSWPASAPAQVLSEIEAPGGAGKVERKLEDARRKDPKAVIFPESAVNFMGYEHLQSGDTKGAIEIMKLNAKAYPDSANAYDSLSDAYLADGDNELARENAKKALELLVSDIADPEPRRDAIRESALKKLTQLGEGQR